MNVQIKHLTLAVLLCTLNVFVLASDHGARKRAKFVAPGTSSLSPLTTTSSPYDETQSHNLQENLPTYCGITRKRYETCECISTSIAVLPTAGAIFDYICLGSLSRHSGLDPRCLPACSMASLLCALGASTIAGKCQEDETR